ncbi:response regulator [Mycolicibacterium chitae]|uniref:Two-component system response regulator n=1 Tax=Mycolicibacterium chitae TaxID=1792 RepID=A0A448I8W9_MYCCI|nr:hypothetical protein [Mycolicibacterium chitae]BBZ05248.1 response regulator [Mycolicibacterium chitae]VEG48867.1 two-component system response regulator [Mycolicibacterium chitae]
MRVLIYSSDAATRREIRQGLRADTDCLEVGTQAVLLAHIEAAVCEVAILDGESTPAGGIGLAKQLRDEFSTLPWLIVLTGRPGDGWLARWSGADAVLSRPIDPFALAAAVSAARDSPPPIPLMGDGNRSGSSHCDRHVLTLEEA